MLRLHQKSIPSFRWLSVPSLLPSLLAGVVSLILLLDLSPLNKTKGFPFCGYANICFYIRSLHWLVNSCILQWSVKLMALPLIATWHSSSRNASLTRSLFRVSLCTKSTQYKIYTVLLYAAYYWLLIETRNDNSQIFWSDHRLMDLHFPNGQTVLIGTTEITRKNFLLSGWTINIILH